MSNLARELKQTRKAYNGRESYIRITEAELKCIYRNCTYIAIHEQVKQQPRAQRSLVHSFISLINSLLKHFIKHIICITNPQMKIKIEIKTNPKHIIENTMKQDAQTNQTKPINNQIKPKQTHK